MSLYVGNLSSGVRLDELERVFQKFGRCSVRMKDGYGFVVYDFPPNAERALRALQDRYICGEQLTLSWSNRQPGAFRGAGRGRGSSFRGRGGVREGGFRERVGGRDREGGRGSYGVRANVVDEGLGRREDVDEDGEPRRIMDDDRWGAQFEGAVNGAGTENGGDVARYEPSRDYEKNDDADENRVLPRARENAGRGHIREYGMNRSSRANGKQGCYQCGAVGHKMRDCLRGSFSGRKLYRFDSRRGEENKRKNLGREEIERSSRPKKRTRFSQDSGPVSREMSGGKSPHSVQHRRSRRDGRSPARNEAENSEKNDYGGKRRSGEETEFVKEYSRKKEKTSVSSRLDSDNNNLSRSDSKSHSSNHKQGSRSRSVSSRAHSASSSSRSSLPRRNRRPTGLISRSRSVSPTCSPLSVPTGKPSTCSPNKAERTAEIYSDDVAELKGALTEQGGLVEIGDLSGDAEPENLPEATNDELVTLPSKIDKIKQDGLEKNNENCEKVLGSADEEARESSDPEDDIFVDAGNSLEQRLAGTTDFKNFDALINDELATLPSKMRKVEQDGPPEENTENCEIVLCSADEVARESRDPGDDTFVDAGNSLEQRLTGTKDFQNCDGLITERPSHTVINTKDHDTSYINPSTKISSEELSMVLKHYGLSFLDESRTDLYPEDYFGSARLWPWEVIYYRRLKKGPISLQNYARRVELNREFGITDKYIRSSSGWGELGKGNL